MKLLLSLAMATLCGFGVAALAAPTASAIDYSKASMPAKKSISAGPAALQPAACKGGETGVAKAICLDPKAGAADARMQVKFTRALAQSTSSERQTLQDNQDTWLRDREVTCRAADATAEPADIKCVIEQADERSKLLGGAPQAGPGAGSTIIPIFEGDRADGILSLRFAQPDSVGEKLLNQLLGAGLARVRADAKKGLSDKVYTELTYASPTFVSANVMGYYVTGTTDDDIQYLDYNINIDMRTGKELAFADAFQLRVLPGLEKNCIAQLRKWPAPEPGDERADASDLIEIAKSMPPDLSRWSFGAKSASVVLDPDDYVASSCAFDYRALRSLLQPGFPLPQ